MLKRLDMTSKILPEGDMMRAEYLQVGWLNGKEGGEKEV
jgi:hypothetical protein